LCTSIPAIRYGIGLSSWERRACLVTSIRVASYCRARTRRRSIIRFYSLRIARAVGSTGRVTAVDVSETYLEKLRARLQQDNVTNVDVIVGAVDDPHLPPDTFDGVLIYNAYHEMTTPEPILKSILAALKPGGRLVMSEPLHDNVRSATRAEQVKDHEIGPNFVEQELKVAGFEIVEQRPDFLAFTEPGHKGGFWLMVARQPVR
jgi:SAM-dependent methyltransferase